MKFYIGVTDNNWFNYLRSFNPDEVNFWRPGGSGFGAIDVGSLFLFKLKKPIDKIVGGGFFVKSTKLPLALAWDAFEEKNGATSFEDLRKLINAHRNHIELNPQIGCIILSEPFFLPENKWVDVPSDWPYSAPGKVYDSADYEGRRIFNEIEFRLGDNLYNGQIVSEPTLHYGKEYLVRGRVGQGAFKILVADAYNKRCAISGEKVLTVLEAAHIKPYRKKGPNWIRNGLLLRSDLHILFDKGYLTLTADHKVEVSRRIKEEFNNGKHYYAFHGKKLYALPKFVEDRPGLEFIRWHNQNRFNG
jgi:putative restriction endonuclease